MITTLVRRVLPLALLGALLAYLAREQAVPSAYSDLWFHLRFGREFLGPWSLGSPGHLSRYDTADWVPTQWLPQELMAWAETWAGVAGVVWISAVLVMVLVGMLYLVCRRAASPLPAVASTTLAIVSALPGLTARPQLVSYVLIVVTVSAWLRTARDGRPRYWLIAVAWVWPMCHGMWPVGITVSLAAVAGLALSGTTDRARLRRLSAIPVASALVAALTPIGLDTYRVVVTVGGRTDYFWEWGPPDFTSPNAAVLAVMLALAMWAGLRSGPVGSVHTAFLLLALVWGLYSMRTTPVASLIAAPVLAELLQRWLPDVGPPSRGERALVGAMVVLACGAAGMVLALRSNDHVVPTWVDARLDSMSTGTRILNDWDSGAYFLYRHDDLELVMHGYGEVFTDAELDRNVTISRVGPRWDELVTGLEVDYALLHPDSSLAYELVEHASWSVVQADEDFALLSPPPDGLIG